MEVTHTLSLTIHDDLIASDGCEHFHSPFRSCDQNIETSFTTFPSKRPEPLSWGATRNIRAVCTRNNHDVTLVALNIFQVPDEKRFSYVVCCQASHRYVKPAVSSLHRL